MIMKIISPRRRRHSAPRRPGWTRRPRDGLPTGTFSQPRPIIPTKIRGLNVSTPQD